MQGDEETTFEYSFDALSEKQKAFTFSGAEVVVSWDEVFSAIAPKLLNEARELEMRNALRRFLEERAAHDIEAKAAEWKFSHPRNVKLDEHDIDTAIIQMRARGLIAESTRKRSVTDTQKYWALTPFGDRRMVQLRAVHRLPAVAKEEGGVPYLQGWRTGIRSSPCPR